MFITTLFFVNTVIFDIKDIQGDRKSGITTIPVKYGIRKAKIICGAAVALLLVEVSALISFDIKYALLFPMVIYTAAYVILAKKGDFPWWFYGVFVDGEYYVFLIALILYNVINRLC